MCDFSKIQEKFEKKIDKPLAEMIMYVYLSLEILDQIARHCPRALSTFVLCLGRANEVNHCVFSKEDIQLEMHESYTVFKNNLKSLSREGVLEWHNIDGKVHVTLANFDD